MLGVGGSWIVSVVDSKILSPVQVFFHNVDADDSCEFYSGHPL